MRARCPDTTPNLGAVRSQVGLQAWMNVCVCVHGWRDERERERDGEMKGWFLGGEEYIHVDLDD